MRRHLTRMVKSLSSFGFKDGSVAYYLYVSHRLVKANKWAVREIRVKGANKPIFIRPGVSDWIALERIFIDREYDHLSSNHDDKMNILQRKIILSGRQPLIIDCGANIGLSSIWLSERFPEAVIASIEPEAENYRVLEKNASHYRNIVPIRAAVSDDLSFVTMSNSTGAPWAWKTEKSLEGSVRTVTIESIIASYQNCIPLIVKIDIEGFETNILTTDTKWIDEVPLVVFEMHDWMDPWSGSGHSFFSALTRQRRDYLIRGENTFSFLHSAFFVENSNKIATSYEPSD